MRVPYSGWYKVYLLIPYHSSTQKFRLKKRKCGFTLKPCVRNNSARYLQAVTVCCRYWVAAFGGRRGDDGGL